MNNILLIALFLPYQSFEFKRNCLKRVVKPCFAFSARMMEGGDYNTVSFDECGFAFWQTKATT